jgi:DNA-binding transcriptional LysR family regulator
MSTFPSNAAVGTISADLEWSDLNLILAICRTGSLSGAARTLGVNHSTVFRKINAIEKKTGVRFFERMQDGYAMTDAGRTAKLYAERIEAEVHALGREVLGQDMRLQGNVRLTAPEGFTIQFAPGLLTEFLEKHPDVTIEIDGGSMALDLSRREADIAIRATPKPPDTSLGRKIGAFKFAMYATPDYAKTHKDIPLKEQRFVFITGAVEWLVPLLWKKKEEGEQQSVFNSASAMAVLNAAAEGMGLVFMPCYLADIEPRLVRVTEFVEPLTMEFWLLTHPDLRHTARVKALMSYLYDKLSAESDLFAGERPINPPMLMFDF